MKIAMMGISLLVMLGCTTPRLEVRQHAGDYSLSFDEPTLIAFFCPGSKAATNNWDGKFEDFHSQISGTAEALKMKDPYLTYLFEGCSLSIMHKHEKIQFPKYAFGYCMYHPALGPKFVEGIENDLDLFLATKAYFRHAVDHIDKGTKN